MAKSRVVNTKILDDAEGQKELKDARARARRKLADQVAMQELGLDDGGAVIKGPIAIPGEEQYTLTLDMYEGADRLFIDGKYYMNGATYTVGKRLYDTMRDMIARGWEHQREIEGKDRNAYRKQANIIISPNGVKAA